MGDRVLDTPSSAAARMAAAAGAWLDSLEPAQHVVARFPGPGEDEESEQERLRWYYTPTDHGGLPLGHQSPSQQQLAMRLVATGLSDAGYATVATIIGLENVLDRDEGWSVDWGRERGRDPGLFYLRVFGDPGSGRWAWRLGGHHVSLNNLVLEHRLASCTPCFLGVDPASTRLLGDQVLRPLGGTEDLGRRLMRSLSPAAAARALIHDRPVSDIVSGNRPLVVDGDEMMHMQDLFRDRFTQIRLSDLVDSIDLRAESGSGYGHDDHAAVALSLSPRGIGGADLDDAQRGLLRELLRCYHGRAPAALADREEARYAEDAELDRVHFAWAGPIGAGEPHYYRLQGPSLLAEWDNTQRLANHAHSVWRHPTQDFGLDLLGSHRQAHHTPPHTPHRQQHQET